MASPRATKRLQKELLDLKKNPIPYVRDVKPLEDNILEFHFCVSFFYLSIFGLKYIYIYQNIIYFVYKSIFFN